MIEWRKELILSYSERVFGVTFINDDMFATLEAEWFKERALSILYKIQGVISTYKDYSFYEKMLVKRKVKTRIESYSRQISNLLDQARWNIMNRKIAESKWKSLPIIDISGKKV